MSTPNGQSHVAIVLVVPSMALLYTLTQRSLIEETSSPTASASEKWQQ